MIKVSDYIAQFIADTGVRHVFSLAGGQIMHIMDSIGRHPQLTYVSVLHEQAAAMMAEAYSRATDNYGICLVTTGPGGTNAMTGLAGAWYDSTPCMFISGQFRVETLPLGSDIRQSVLQQTFPVSFVRPLTKYAELVGSPSRIRYHLEKALYLSRHGRPGPVWLDIPLDVQGAVVEPAELDHFDAAAEGFTNARPDIDASVAECAERIRAAQRPVLLIGNGVRLAGAVPAVRRLLEKLQAPVLTSINGMDLIEHDHPLFMGRPNYWGQRHANFIIQNSDLLISLGAGLHLETTGFNFRAFARAAYKIVVDIDPAELRKATVAPDLPIEADCLQFITALDERLEQGAGRRDEWLEYCNRLRSQYPLLVESFYLVKDFVNPYVFTDALSDELAEGEAVIPGNAGTHFTTCVQAFKVRKGQRIISEIGIGAMGHSLPSSIAVSLARNGDRVVCVTGDGGIQVNLQELQTVIAQRLPIKIFIADNSGYMSLKNTQRNYFAGRMVGCNAQSGLVFPDLRKIAEAYGFRNNVISSHAEMRERIRENLDASGPFVSIVRYDPEAVLQPRVSSKMLPNGNMTSTPLEEMWPQLPHDEFMRNMLVPPYGE